LTYPRGKLTQDDEGQLQVRIGIRDATVIMDFDKPIRWLGMAPNNARDLAALLVQRADEIDSKKGPLQ